MNETGPMGVGECVSRLARDSDHVVDAESPLPVEPVAQGLARHERHHVIKEAVGIAEIVQREDMGMVESSRDGDLAEKPLGADRELETKDFDRDLTMVLEVVSEEHDRHPTPTDHP